jgi:hypothetical protein
MHVARIVDRIGKEFLACITLAVDLNQACRAMNVTGGLFVLRCWISLDGIF